MGAELETFVIAERDVPVKLVESLVCVKIVGILHNATTNCCQGNALSEVPGLALRVISECVGDHRLAKRAEASRGLRNVTLSLPQHRFRKRAFAIIFK